LTEVGYDPCFAIGGILSKLQSNSGYGKGEYFVAEACESDGTFLKYHPWGAIVTNIDTDHMDFFKNESALLGAFKQFMSQVSSHEHLFWCGDDERLPILKPPGISYGFDKHCALRASQFIQDGWKIIFDIHDGDKTYSQVEVALTGKHNALNALAVFGLCL